MFGDGRRGDLMLHVSKSRYATGPLDCSIGTEHVLAIALQQGMQKKLLRNSVAAQRVGARFSRQPLLLQLGTKRISVHPVPSCLHRPRGGLTRWPRLARLGRVLVPTCCSHGMVSPELPPTGPSREVG